MSVIKTAYKIVPQLSRHGNLHLTVTKQFKLDISHRIWNQVLPDGMECKCVQFHGHTCFVEVTIEGPYNPSSGMLIDFNIIKAIVKDIEREFDHKLLIDVNDPLFEDMKDKPGVVALPFVPTAENLAILIGEYFNQRLPDKFKVQKVRWYETPTAWADVHF